MKRTLSCVAALAVTVFSSLTLAAGVYAPPEAAVAIAHPVLAMKVIAPSMPLIPAVPAKPASPSRYAVRPGDSLSAIAVRYCGHANDWTGIYAANRRVIGADPNLIFPGQRLAIGRCADPPALLRLGRHQHHTAHQAATHVGRNGKIWGVTYGYPNFCGDGDRDGWDVACATRIRHTAIPAHITHRPFHRTYHTSVVSHSASYYSFAGLEALWISAGGPAWAAAHAARIAECESGGRTSAYNPSGATGLWQILGQVVGGSLTNPYTNALNAVSKFRASGDTFAQWVCQ